jgi:pimeloyl-ACP methyl ester carboxylesterase
MSGLMAILLLTICMKEFTMLKLQHWLALCLAGAVIFPSRVSAQSPSDSYALFEQPGKMVRLPQGNRLSMYCQGAGSPTVFLETGFGGGAYLAWHELQPRLAKFTRVCSYDRAGYGFSELGDDLPRDLHHDVSDLHALLAASGESGPYILVGHSDGGHIIGAFSDSFPRQVAGLVFLDAAVLLDKQQVSGPTDKPSPDLQKYYDDQLRQIRSCVARAKDAIGPLQAKPGDYCLDSKDLVGLPPQMSTAVAIIAARPDGWRAFLSEAEQHYLVDDDTWEVSLLPHRWRDVPIRVFTASVASLDDEHSAAAYGLPANDHKAIAAARASRRRWEHLQSRICELSDLCEAHAIPTTQHEVQNAVPDQVAESIRTMILQIRALPVKRS